MTQRLLIPALLASGFAFTLVTALWRGEFHPLAVQPTARATKPLQAQPAVALAPRRIAWNSLRASRGSAAPGAAAASAPGPASSQAESPDSDAGAAQQAVASAPVDMDSYIESRDRAALHTSRSR